MTGASAPSPAPAPDFLRRCGSELLLAARSLPRHCAAALWRKCWGWAALGAAAAGALAGWGGSLLFPLSPPDFGAGILAAAFSLNLLLLALLPALLPSTTAAWGGLSAWLRATLLAAAAFLGLKLGVGERLAWDTLLTLFSLTAAQAIFWTGLGAVLLGSLGPERAAPRLILGGLLALSASALLWSRQPLLALYKKEPELGSRAAALVMEFSPPLAVAGAWRSPSGGGFDLAKGSLSYRLWLGSYLSLTYPHLWPRRAPVGPLAWGLILELFLWGAAVLFCGEALFAIRRGWRGGAAGT